MYFGFVCKFFVFEVLEIVVGLVEIVVLVCEVGYCIKIVVKVNDLFINVKGVCIGEFGCCVCVVIEEFVGEKIDIVDYDVDLLIFVVYVFLFVKVMSVFVFDVGIKVVCVLVLDY